MIAALSAWHEEHESAAQALRTVTAIPAHALLEAYAVLTRLPSGLAVPASAAASVLARRFADPPLRLDDSEERAAVQTMARAGVLGGSSYDGLVALQARAHGRTLLTLDTRAQVTYQRLGVAFSVIGA